MKRVVFSAHDGHAIAAYHFEPAGEPKANVIIASAMAVPQSFYAAFARYLATQGYAAWTFDYRGIGESRPGPLRKVKADLSDWLVKDYDGFLHDVSERSPGKPLFVVGHSFGGQVAPLLPSRERLSGLINIAVGSGAMRHNTPRIRRTAPLLWHVLAPALCPVFGYFPGARLGIIGDLPSGAMFQWRRWCLTPDYLLTGEPGAREAYASAEFPVLALTFADDELLLEDGSRLIHDAYLLRQVDYRVLKAVDHGLPRIGHFGFFKPQSETALWPLVTDWIDRAHER
ncbi:MAG: alpha/beta fold hydrolase [Burkholderiaceae bacterium]|nr:alpha/beta fold hydrolase [Sulfuritalea sp.]MCF8174896.1 alpha/beta fold hydrolase [Burkholderiaceae bacterium]MCF8184304.1 alpha/beta fold hydrolase [Polynucleobacter sp.]